MKVFLIEFGGHWLGGRMVIVDKTQRTAFNKAKKKIEDMGLSDFNEDFTIDNVVELDTNKESVVVTDDGNY